MLPDSNQQSNTSSMRRKTPLPRLLGIVMLSTLSLWMSVISPLYPLLSFSSAILPMQTSSSMFSLAHIGIGVPQNLFLEMFQSLAFEIQFANLFSLANEG